MEPSQRPPPGSVQEQYSDASNLLARSGLHERFSANKRGWLAWAFDQLDLPPDADVLELGCGDGGLWAHNRQRIPAGWRITLTDQSPAMLEAARRNLSGLGRDFAFQLADAGAIPFEDGRFDAVLVCFLFHHLPDVDVALREMRRVLRPGGRLYVSANGYDHMHELRELLRPLASDLPFVRQDHLTVFGLRNGHEKVLRHFPRVDLRLYEDSLEVTEVEPLVEYALSLRGAKAAMTREKTDRLRRSLAERMTRDGVIRIAKSTGMFVAARNAPPRRSLVGG